MEMMQSIIESLGFPMAVCFAFGYYIMRKDNQEQLDKQRLTEELAENRAERKAFAEERKGFIEVLNKFNTRFEVLEIKVDNISSKIDK